MIPREQQKQRVVIRPAKHSTAQHNKTHFNARQTINSILHTNRFLFGLAERVGENGEYECGCMCCFAMNFYPHQIQFDWLGKWH